METGHSAARRLLCGAGLALAAGCASSSAPSAPSAPSGPSAPATPSAPSASQAAAELAPTGRIRAAINLGNPILAGLDANGAPTGVSVDLIPFKSAGTVVEAIKAGDVDLAFVAIDPVRGADMAYTAPYVIIEGAYLVRQDSPLRSNEEVDRAGQRIVVGKGSAYDLYLTRELKAATLVRVATSPAVVDEFLKQQMEVAAGVRQQLDMDARRLGGLRMLPGRFMVIEQAMGVPKGRLAAQAWLSRYVEEMKRSGFVATALQRHGIEGASVAPERGGG